ncbi:MAG TPA: cob(I)yrinic acid a,c-diamide adenosyltransferase [Calditrichaeota bacterium]|nr:cob(I)yrinic acid a,c-diamide adenosyltransferase [Calditrichota bacterium]
MKIYTGFGDRGKTSLLGGEVVPKNDLRIELYGTLDELNSLLGFLRSKNKDGQIDMWLRREQNHIFTLSSEIASPDPKIRHKIKSTITLTEAGQLEKEMDELSQKLPVLKSFILPGGCEEAAIAHLARTVCRRCERLLVSLHERDKQRAELLVYLNRLSDWFFMLARYLNKLNGQADIEWRGRKQNEK